jgi:hypothetical protein
MCYFSNLNGLLAGQNNVSEVMRMFTQRSMLATTLSAMLLMLSMLLSSACNAETVTIYASSDTYLQESAPNYNYGDEIEIHIRNNQSQPYDRVTLIGFNLSSIPSNAVITQATLKLYQYETSYMDENDWLKVGAYRLLKHADEGTGGYQDGATWYHRHANGQDPWSQAGARGRSATDPDRHSANNLGIPDSVVTLTYIPIGGSGRWIEWDVTPSAQFWHRNPTKNYGLVLDKWLEGNYCYDNQQWIKFWSREYSDPNYRPRLIVTYIIPSSQPTLTLRLGDFNLNSFNADPGITFTIDNGQLRCSGTTTDTIWDGDGSLSTYTLNAGFECDIRVKLQQGIVGTNRGQYAFMMWENADKYIRLQAVGYGAQYYEISGRCPAIGNGKRHDGTAYWASYWDDGYPAGPPSSAVLFFSETPSAEQSTYITWRIRYDKLNQVFSAYVIDGNFSRLVTYYTGVDFTNFRIALLHSNDYSGVNTDVWTIFPDSTPPSPDPMTWFSPPYAVSTSQIDMIATTATDDTPPIKYQFEEVTGNPGGTSSAWQTSVTYSDVGLLANTRYGYKVKAQDSATPPNTTAYSEIAYCYTLIPTPTQCKAYTPTTTRVNLAAQGSFPNLNEGLTGVQFQDISGQWIGEWKLNQTTDTATGLTPNTLYTFKVRARNGDGIPTDWSPQTASIRTLAAQPIAKPYNPVTTQSIRVNWDPNGNPDGTEYFCWEETTGKNSGWITQTSWTLTGLEPNTVYNFHVKARNADGIETAITHLGPVTTGESIGMIKRGHSPGEMVRMSSKVVTAVFQRSLLIFVQDWPDITKPWGGLGIGVRWPYFGMINVSEGDLVDIVGTLTYNDPPYNQELIVSADQINKIGVASAIVPFGSMGRSLGGGEFGNQPGLYDNTIADPPKPSYGLNITGMLVKAWGRLIESDPATGSVWIDDGSQLNDGTMPEISGIRVELRHLGGIGIIPKQGYISVTGIMRCYVKEPEGLNVRVIWPRKLSDLVVHE